MSRSNFGHIQRVSKGKYRIYWDGPPKPDGGRNQRSRTVNGTRDDAEVELARIRVGAKGAPRSATLRDYWLVSVEPTLCALEPKTAHEYRRLWAREIEPRLGGVRVDALTQTAAQAAIGAVGSPSVQRSAAALLKKVCNMAMGDMLLDRNPVTRALRMKRAKPRGKTMVEARDMPGYLASLSGTRYLGLAALEVGGGLRHEEAVAVTGSDVSPFEDGGRLYAAVQVRRALVTVNGRKLLKDTKNGFSEREAVLGEPFASLVLGFAGGKDAALLPGPRPEGSAPNETWFANPATVTHNWRDWCGAHDVPYVRFGDMRTVYSTLHGEAGSPDSLVSLSMGHSDGTTRGRNYQKHTRRGMVLIADCLTDYLFESAPCYEMLHRMFA